MRQFKRLERTGTNALPYINTPSFWVPDATLREHVPVDVELPDARCVANNSCGHVVDGWMVIEGNGGVKRQSAL